MEMKRKLIGNGVRIFIAVILGVVLLWFACALVKDHIRSNRRHPGTTPIRTQFAEIEKAVQIYAMGHNGKLPASLDDLVQGTDDNPPLIKPESLLDPWGIPIGYERNGKSFTLRSSGPDREMGTADDLTN